jgi:hypothetical protein
MREIAISQSPETTVTSAYPSSAESIGTPSSSQEASPALATDHRLSPYASPTTRPASTTMPRRLTEDKATKLGYVRAKMACSMYSSCANVGLEIARQDDGIFQFDPCGRADRLDQLTAADVRFDASNSRRTRRASDAANPDKSVNSYL